MKNKLTKDFENLIALVFSSVLAVSLNFLLNYTLDEKLLSLVGVEIRTLTHVYFWFAILILAATYWQWHVWGATLAVFESIEIKTILAGVLILILPLYYAGIYAAISGIGVSQLDYFEPLSLLFFVSLIQPFIAVLLSWLEQKKITTL